MNEREFAEQVHMEIHAVRRIKGYKPNPMEVNISRLVLKMFGETCNECKEVEEKLSKQPQKREGIVAKILGNID